MKERLSAPKLLDGCVQGEEAGIHKEEYGSVLRMVREFADLMLEYGRDDYGPRRSPLFAGQLNVETRMLPKRTKSDPGMFENNRETAGCGPSLHNLLFDFGLLDVLSSLSAVTGDAKYREAALSHVAYSLENAKHPISGMLAWGEHAGYDIEQDRIRCGRHKGWHEVKVVRIPWDLLWEIDPETTRHEIEFSMRNHICDEAVSDYNRHAGMDGIPNKGHIEPTAIACSGGVYMHAWAWLHVRTGEAKFLDWAAGINNFHRTLTSKTTGLFSSANDRPTEMWYHDPQEFAVHLLDAAAVLGTEKGADFRKTAIGYLRAYARHIVDRETGEFFDSVDIETGRPVAGVSKHCSARVPADERAAWVRPRFLARWDRPENCGNLPSVVSVAGVCFALTGDEYSRTILDSGLALLELDKMGERSEPVPAGDIAAVLGALIHAGRRNRQYMTQARWLVDYSIARLMKNGFFVSGLKGGECYYWARSGSNDLAAALLAFALAEAGNSDVPLPPVRNPWGCWPLYPDRKDI